MLHLLYGPAASGKTDLLMGRIRTAVAARTPGQVLLVPEQYSHEAERALCAACGDSLSLYAEVLSFTGLARRVAAETGAGEAPLLDQGGRLLCMALALSQVAPRLRLFGAAARRPQMQQTLLGAVDELKTACVTPDALEATAARCPGYLGDKLRDLALVLAAYDAVTAQGHADPTDRLTRLAERIPASTLGRTGHFYLDGFTDYTRQELAVVRALLTAGADVTVCLTLDQLSGGSEIFGAARRTARVLLDMADDCGVQATVESCPARAADTPLRVLEQQLFSYTSAHFDDPAQTITVHTADDLAAECAWAAARALQIVQSGCRWRDIAIAVRGFSDYAPALERMLARNQVSVAFLKAEKPEWGAELERLCADSVRLIRLEPVDGRSALCALVSGEPDTPPDVPVSRDDVACRLHTSGTTGEPKCVVYTHGGMLREIVSMLQVYPYPDGQRYQFIAQLFHSAAIGAHLSLATGGTMVLKDHFALEDYMHTLVSERIESISVVPTVLKWILDETDNGDYDLSHLKTVNYSTCPIPKALLQRAIEKLHCSFYQSYGMTEMGSTVTALLPEDHLRDGGKYLSSVGRPIPGAAVRIVAPDGSDCPAGTAGEIYVRGPGRMLEYLDAPETTHAALVGGWYRTKDMGMLDAQGYLFLSGRADDLIISGGENIYPGEVTNVIMQLCDDVAEVAVYGVPDETWGEHVKASVVLMPGSRLTAEALRQYCRAHMPTFRAPKEIEIVPELPKGATGKVLTAVLRARSVQAS